MVEYRDANSNVVEMEDALTRSQFSVVWVDAAVQCTRPRFDENWTVTRTVDGLMAGFGKVTRVNHAFYRNGSAHAYNTFDEAARMIIEPV